MSDRSDFNDLSRVAGDGAVAAVVMEAIAKAKAPPASSAGNWPEPIPPGARQVPEISGEIIPGVFGEYVQALAAHTQTPPALATMFVLSCLASAVQGRYEVAPLGVENGWREVLALWTCGCYPPGGKKSAIYSAAMAPILHWEKNAGDRLRPEIYRRRSVREVSAKRIEKLKQDAARLDDDNERHRVQEQIRTIMEEMPGELFAPKVFTGNASPERVESLMVEQNGKIAALSDEADQLLNLSGANRGGAVTLESTLKAHDGSPMRADRQSRSAHIDRPTMSMGLIVQPESFGELASSSKRMRSTGLLGRFLYVVPQSTIGRRNVRHSAPIPSDLAERYHLAMMDLLQGYEVRGVTPKLLPFASEATEPFYQFMEFIEERQGDGGEMEAITDWSAKLAGRAARLAALFEIAERGRAAVSVSLANVERAIVLAKLLIPHAEVAFSLLGADDTDVDALAVLRWIKANGQLEFTRREAQRAMHSRFSKVERLEKAIAVLQGGYVLSGEKKAQTGGRASAFYLVNPKVFDKR